MIRLPDFWSHHFAAKKADEKRRTTKPKHLVWSADFDNLYTFGAQGPDFFYYIGKFNPLSKHHYGDVGNQVHELDTRVLFQEMLDFMIKTPSEALMAYISGFISHYIMDVHCHPLICLLGPDNTSHKRVELDLEAFCVHDYWKISWHTLNVKAIKCNDNYLRQGYVELWQYLLPKCYHVSIKEVELLKGHVSMLRIQKLLVNDTLSHMPFLNVLTKLFNYDLSALRYPDVNDEALKTLREYKTFQDQYSKGIEETSKALIALDSVLDGTITVEHFIKTFIKYDFLGEA